jgi:hypothetical protein
VKEAGRFYLPQMRELARAGDLAGVESMARKLHAAGKLKISGPGTQLHRLGVGAEGVAHLTIGAADDPAKVMVRKTFDPKSPFVSKETLGEKVQALRMLKGKEEFAQLQSKRLGRGASGGRYLHMEYVPGKEQEAMANALGSGGLERALAEKRRALIDIRGNPGNVLVTPAGKARAIDFLPTSAEKARTVHEAFVPANRRLGIEGQEILPGGPFARMLPRLQADPAAMQRFQNWTQGKTISLAQQHLGFGTQPTDVIPGIGIRRADPARALRGLGPGSPRKS